MRIGRTLALLCLSAIGSSGLSACAEKQDATRPEGRQFFLVENLDVAHNQERFCARARPFFRDHGFKVIACRDVIKDANAIQLADSEKELVFIQGAGDSWYFWAQFFDADRIETETDKSQMTALVKELEREF